MRTNIRSRLLAATLPALALACGGGSTEPLAECTIEPIELSVAGGTRPWISWDPPCRLGYLTVQRPLPPSLGSLGVEPQWTIRSDGRAIAPPVRYGVAPRGATELVTPRQLVGGVSYSVVVDRNGGGVLGSGIFTP